LAKAIPEILPPEAAAALRRVGIEATPEKVAAVIAASLSISRSPFPSAEMLKEYDAYRQGMGAEVVQWLKDQTLHRQSLEKLTTESNETRLNSSLANAFKIAVLGMIAAGVISIGARQQRLSWRLLRLEVHRARAL
jgi:hypothetical protein